MVDGIQIKIMKTLKSVWAFIEAMLLTMLLLLFVTILIIFVMLIPFAVVVGFVVILKFLFTLAFGGVIFNHTF